MWKDSETEIDYLDFSYIVEIMKDTINDENLLPSCIGLYGDWGSGKSSLMHMCKKQLEEQKDGTVCLLFNGWLYESYDDAKTAILASILDGIKECRELSGAAKITLKALYDSIDKFKVIKGGIKFGIDMAVTGGLGAITNLAIKEITKKAKKVAEDVDEETMFQAIKDKLDYKEVREDIREFREKFAELIEEAGIKKLVIFVDELDRCNPATILDTLEAMRLFLFSGNVSFVIGADERHVTYAIRSKFDDIEGINMDIGKEYQGFETDQEDKINALDPWKNELWVKKWMKAKPMLSEEKLENYFYFMRASAKDNIFTSVEKMSEEAKKIFEGISKHSDLAFNQAKMAVDKISVFDQHQILDGLYQDVISDDSYEKEKVRFFLLWGALNEQLQENTIKYCTDLSAQKISVSQIPYFEGFYAQCKNKGAMKTILERWKSENTTLKTAIEDFL